MPDLNSYGPDAAPDLTLDYALGVKDRGGNWSVQNIQWEVLRRLFTGRGLINYQTVSNYTLTLADRGNTVEMDRASANAVVIPTEAVVAFAPGDSLYVVRIGAGTTIVNGAVGVTLNGSPEGSVEIPAQYGWVRLYKRSTDEWMAIGDNIAATPPQSITTRDGVGIASLAALETWHQANSGPTVSLTSTSGVFTINSQADANAIVGKRITGQVVISASNLELHDFEVIYDGNSSHAELITCDAGHDNVWVHDFKCDCLNQGPSRGIGGTLFATNFTFERGEIANYWYDGLKTFKNSTYRHMYLHDALEWDEGTMGTYVPNGDQNIYPHTDGMQTLRSGNLIEECWIVNSVGDNAISCLLTKSDTNEQINGFTARRNYFDGGLFHVHVHNANADINNPGTFGHPINIVLQDNLHGRAWRAGIFSYSVPAANISFINNRFADDLTLVPTDEGPI